MKKPIFAIHVGFPKTGTTTLQNHLFSRHSQVEYLGKPYADDQFKEGLFHLMMSDSVVYQPEMFPVKEYIRDREESMEPSKRVIMLSEEIFLSYSKVRDKGQVARRVRDVLAPDKIIITLRNQFNLLKSAYLGRGRLMVNVPSRFSGLSVTFEQWLALSYESIQSNFIELADYVKTVDYYSRIFGKEKVQVLLLEELVKDKESYLGRMSEFLGIDADESLQWLRDAHDNRGISQAMLDSELLRTRWFPFHRFPPVAGALKLVSFIKKKRFKDAAAKADLPGPWAERLKNLYSKGNQRLAEEYGLPLEKYEYPL
ncbi:MAG: sulfotransferase [bacterium]|nr:sulfotransferase [bacterium]